MIFILWDVFERALSPLYFFNISVNSAAICVNFDLSKDSTLPKHLPKIKFKQFLRINNLKIRIT
jgi:hypothetical protein